jgi:phage shock protein PspC (stress-responsive transcriptional regulator)
MGEFAGTGPKRRLMRRPEEGKIAGVCAGLADYFDADVALVRAAWVVLAIWPGAVVLGVIAYVAAWLIMPRADGVIAAAPTPRLVRSRTDKRIAGVCGGLAEYFEVDPTIMRVAWVVVSIVVGAVVFGVVAYLVAWFIIPPAPAAAWSPSPSMP